MTEHLGCGRGADGGCQLQQVCKLMVCMFYNILEVLGGLEYSVGIGY